MDEKVVEFSNLKSIELRGLPNIRSFYHVFRSQEEEKREDKIDEVKAFFNSKVSFPSLEELTIENLQRNTTIWENQFGVEVAISFQRLRKLCVENCENIVNVVFSKLQMDEKMFEFSNLKSIELKGLPDIRSFYDVLRSEEEEKTEDKIDEVKALFNSKVSFPSLEELTIENLQSITTIWENQFGVEVAISFQRLRKLCVENCENIVNVVFSKLQMDEKMVEFSNLESIELRGLSDIRSFYHVFRSQEEEKREDKIDEVKALFNSKVSFPSLKELTIENLQSITTIWENQFGVEVAISFRRLRKLCVKNCENIVNVIFSKLQMDEKVVEFSILKSIELRGLPNIRSFYHVFRSQEEEKREDKIDEVKALFNSKVSFPSLERLVFQGLDSITSTWDNQFGQRAAESFQLLKELKVSDEEEIFGSIEASSNTPGKKIAEWEVEDNCLFPKLRYIRLYRQPNLKSISKVPSLVTCHISEVPSSVTHSNIAGCSTLRKAQASNVSTPSCSESELLPLPLPKRRRIQ